MPLTTLQAVNEILEGIGEPPVTALDTGNTSDEAEAETFLDRFDKRVQTTGWAQNTEYDVELHFASVTLTGTIAAGATTFTKGERVTQTTSGAVGIITAAYTNPNTSYVICPLDGSAAFDGTNIITGAVSAKVTATTSDVATNTSGVIEVEQDVLTIKNPSDPNAVIRNGRLYDVDNDDNNTGGTATFDDSVYVDLVRLVTFTELSDPLQAYIVATAAYHFQRYKKRGELDDKVLGQNMIAAKVDANRENRILLGQRANVLMTPGARRIRGNRSRIGYTSNAPLSV